MSKVYLFQAYHVDHDHETTFMCIRYTENTFMLTQSAGSSMKFHFYGSYIGVFGAKRPNHGNYTAQLDLNAFPVFNGQSNVSSFNQTLFEISTHQGIHDLTVTNQGTAYLDIDYVRPRKRFGILYSLST